KDGSQTTVIFVNSLAYFKDPAKILSEALRILGKDGRLVISTGGLQDEALTERDRIFLRETLRHPLTRSQLLSALADAGFKVTKEDTVNLFYGLHNPVTGGTDTVKGPEEIFI